MFYDVPNGWPNNTGCFNMGTWNLTDSHIPIPEYVMLWNTWTLNSSCYPESRIRSWAHGPDLLCWWNTWVAAAVAASNQTSQYGPGQLLQYRNHPILRGQFIYRHLPAIYDYLIITMVYSINIYIYIYTEMFKCSKLRTHPRAETRTKRTEFFLRLLLRITSAERWGCELLSLGLVGGFNPWGPPQLRLPQVISVWAYAWAW